MLSMSVKHGSFNNHRATLQHDEPDGRALTWFSCGAMWSRTDALNLQHDGARLAPPSSLSRLFRQSGQLLFHPRHEQGLSFGVGVNTIGLHQFWPGGYVI